MRMIFTASTERVNMPFLDLACARVFNSRSFSGLLSSQIVVHALSTNSGLHIMANEVPDLFQMKTPTQQLKHQTVIPVMSSNYAKHFYFSASGREYTGHDVYNMMLKLKEERC